MTESGVELELVGVEVAVVEEVEKGVNVFMVGGTRGTPRPTRRRWGKRSRQIWHSCSWGEQQKLFLSSSRVKNLPAPRT